MALAVLDLATYPPIHPYEWKEDRPVYVVRFSGGAEQRAAILSRKLLRFTLAWRKTSALLAYLDAFLEARGFRMESFLVKDLKAYARTGVALGTAAALEVDFELPVTGMYGGDYPIDDVHAVLYADAAPVTATVDTDGRKFTAAVAPGAGKVMTADYWYYRRVRLDSDVRWLEPVSGTYAIQVELQEVPSGT